MQHTQAKKLCDRWLPSWTGGKEAVNNLLSHTVVIKGLDIVEVKEGLITRNEVYFDRTPLLSAPFQK